MDNEPAVLLFNEVLDSDSSSTSEDEIQARGPMVQGYIEDVVQQYSDVEFRENFRMNRTTFNHISLMIDEYIASGIVDRGGHTLSAKAQLLIALWHFGTPDSYRSICGRFNIGKATALRTVRRVADALFSLSKNICKWPTGEYLEEVENGFEEMGFPNTIGCIDGMHIRIPKPKDHGLSYSYINRKGFPSIILQGVCDHKMKFIHCYVGEVGSNHDATVLRRSEVFSYINMHEQKFPNNTHLIGDKAYPCLPELMTPYKNNGHLTDAEQNFNYLLSRTRATVERSFCLLQKRFRCLKELLDMQCLEWARSMWLLVVYCIIYVYCKMI